MAEETDVENGRNSNFKVLVALTLILDGVMTYHHASNIDLEYTCKTNFIWIGKTFCGWMYVQTLRLALLGQLHLDLKNHTEKLSIILHTAKMQWSPNLPSYHQVVWNRLQIQLSGYRRSALLCPESLDVYISRIGNFLKRWYIFSQTQSLPAPMTHN